MSYLPNGVLTEKETVEQRLERYFIEFKQRIGQAKKEQWTGDISLTLNLNGGIPAGREISFREKSR